jgi:outer membrane protein TolC
MGTWKDSTKMTTALLCWIFSAWMMPVHGQFIPDNQLLLGDLTQAVIRQNAGLTSRELQIRASRALTESAGALDDPRVSYSVAPSSIGTDIPSDIGNALRVRQTFQVSQLFPWPGKRQLRTELAEARAEIEEANYEQLVVSLVQQARSLWSQLWFADQALSVNAEHTVLLNDLDTVASTQYANGLGLQQDVLQIQTSLVELQHRELILNQEIRRLQARINDLLNQPADTPLGLPRDQLPNRTLPDRNNLLEWVLESEPELMALQARSRLALRNKELVELEDFPDLQVNVGYNELWNDIEQRTLVGVSLNIPLDFGKRSARKAAAGFNYSSSRADIAHLRAKLAADLEQLLSTEEELAHSIELFESELIPKAQQTLNAASANFQGGGGNFQTLIQAQQQLLDLQLQISEMQADRLISISQIDKLSGGRLWPVETDQ